MSEDEDVGETGQLVGGHHGVVCLAHARYHKIPTQRNTKSGFLDVL